jgi:hypothetical protein
MPIEEEEDCAFIKRVMNIQVPRKMGKFLDLIKDCQYRRRVLDNEVS